MIFHGIVDFVRIMFGKIIRPLPKLNETDEITPEQVQGKFHLLLLSCFRKGGEDFPIELKVGDTDTREWKKLASNGGLFYQNCI